MSIKLVSWNVNGIRAVAKKDEFWDWFDNTDADIINFQEVRATQKDIPKKLADVDDYETHFNEAEKKGYSGVGTYSKIKPVNVSRGLGIEELDSEGRVVPDAEEFVRFSVDSPAIIVGTGSDICDHINVTAPERKMYMGKITVAVKPGDKTPFTLIAQSANCKKCYYTVDNL